MKLKRILILSFLTVCLLGLVGAPSSAQIECFDYYESTRFVEPGGGYFCAWVGPGCTECICYFGGVPIQC